jgi:hypothetical protein
MKLGDKGHLNTKKQVLKSGFSPNPTILLRILDELKNLGFGGTGRNP